MDLSNNSVSTISTVSEIHRPKPPGGPKPTSQGFGRSSKGVGKVVRSPYIAASTPYPKSKRSKKVLPANGVTPVQFQHGNVPAVWGPPPTTGHVPHPSVSNFLQSLMKNPGFSAVTTASSSMRGGKHPRSSSCTGRVQPPEPTVVSGQMDAIELRDEVIKLQKEINELRKDLEVAKAQQVRLSKEVRSKDQRIKDLISAGNVGTRDATRSLASSSHNTSASASLVSSLRKQVHSLECALREKDSQVSKQKRSVTSTKLREMRIETETCYREINRLNHLLAEALQSSAGGPVQSARENKIKFEALNQATVRIASEKESLEEENLALKKKIELLQSGSDPLSFSFDSVDLGTRGQIADHYQDHNRAQMLSVVINLEVQCAELQKKVDIITEEKNQVRILYEQRIGELNSQLMDCSRKIHHQENHVTTLQNNELKLKNVIQKLKDDRVHYRKEVEHSQGELQSVQEHLGKEELGKEQIKKEYEALKTDYQNEMIAIDHARKQSMRKMSMFSSDREKRNLAASTIQCYWRKNQAVKKQQRFQKQTEDAVVCIQSVLRGHLTRKKFALSKAPEYTTPQEREVTDSDAIEMIQSAMKGHLTRQAALKSGSSNDTNQQNVTSSLLGYRPPIKTKVNQVTESVFLSHTAKKEDRHKRTSVLLGHLVNHKVKAFDNSESSDEIISDPECALLMDELS